MQAARGASLNPSDHGTDPSGPLKASRPALAILAGVALVGYAADLATKVWAVDALQGRDPVPVVGDLLTFDLVRNPGAAFSTGTAFTEALTVVAITAVAVVLWLARRVRSRVWAVGLGLLLGGVLGNLTDRLFREPGVMRGHVVDFLRLPNWPVFNIADVCINLAAAVIVVQAVRGVSLSGEREGRGGRNTPA